MPTPKEKEPKVETDIEVTKSAPKEIKTEKPELDVEAIKKELEEKSKKELDELLSQKTEAIAKQFEEKLNKIQEENQKEKESFNSIIEGLKNNASTDDILKEIEDANKKEAAANERSKLIKEKEQAEERARQAVEDAERIKAESLEKEKELQRKTEMANFEKELISLKTSKPYLADKIDKLLAEEDYEVQKTDYRFLVKYFDTPEEEEKYQARKKAGKSAFDGTKPSKKDSKTVDQVTDSIVKKILEGNGKNY